MTSPDRFPATIPAGAPPAVLEFGEMMRRAAVLAKTDLVPKAYQGKPEAIVLVGVWGAEHGIPLATAIQEVHIIEGRPSPSAQLRLALIRAAGHEAHFVESSTQRAVIKGRRREYRGDPGAWVEVTWTIDDARRAGLLNCWVERWVNNRKETVVVGDDEGLHDPTKFPEWAQKAFHAGDIREKDNWRRYPAEMLRARAASNLARMEFSDVLLAVGAPAETSEELGFDVGQDIDDAAATADEPAAAAVLVPPDGGEGGEPAAADPGPEPERDVVAPDESPTPPASSEEPARAPAGQPDAAAVRDRLNACSGDQRAAMRAWMAAQNIPDSMDTTVEQLAAVTAELDRRRWGTTP